MWSVSTYISRPFWRTTASDISLDASLNGEWHMLGNFRVRFIFHRGKRGKWCKLVPLCSVFYIFHGGKWSGPEIFRAFDTLLFEVHLTIYHSPLYVKMDARYKRTKDHVENWTLWFIAYFSHSFSLTVASDISLDAPQKGEYHRLKNLRPVPFSIVKNVENGT